MLNPMILKIEGGGERGTHFPLVRDKSGQRPKLLLNFILL